MNKLLFVSSLAATFGLTGCQSTTNSQVSEAEQTSHFSQNVYEVEYQSAQAFFTQSQKLQQTLSSYCLAANGDQTAVKDQWHQTMRTWMALQGQERGPATALEQSWNVQFWPDKKNTTGRKMSLLTKADHAWSAEQISTQSVTVQGLGAL